MKNKNKTNWWILGPVIGFGVIAGTLTNYNILYTTLFGIIGGLFGWIIKKIIKK